MSHPSVALDSIAEYLDTYLRVRDVPDSDDAVNGLQVENGGTVGRIFAAVDVGGVTVLARVTSLAAAELQLAPGMPVWVLVKAVSLRAAAHGSGGPRP